MAKGLTPVDLHKLARVGAAARLDELEREIAALRAAFPGLRAGPASGPPAPSAPASQPALSSRAAKRGRRKPMSAAERKAVSERMKRYWADRRKVKT